MAEENYGDWRNQTEQPQDETQPVSPVPSAEQSENLGAPAEQTADDQPTVDHSGEEQHKEDASYVEQSSQSQPAEALPVDNWQAQTQAPLEWPTLQQTSEVTKTSTADSEPGYPEQSAGQPTEVLATGELTSTISASSATEAPTESIGMHAEGDSATESATDSATDSVQAEKENQYRPAPEYGAYGPVPTQPSYPEPSYGSSQQIGMSPTQPTQQIPIAPNQQSAQNPYFTQNPYFSPQGQQNAQGQPQGAQGQQSRDQAQGQPQTSQPNQSPQPQNQNQNPYYGSAQHLNGPLGSGVPGQGPQGYQNPSRNTPAKSQTSRSILAAVVAAVLTAALCLGFGFAAITNGWVEIPRSGSLASIDSNTSGSGTATGKSGEAADWVAVSKDVSSSVVSITTELSNGIAKGSGAIIDAKGYIVTNNHVISNEKSISVTLSNGQMYTATVVGTDTTTDLAVIKIDNPPSDLKAVDFADSDKLAVGEPVMAIGNPLGYDNTATTGIVSAINRPVTVMDSNNSEVVTNAVQIDAAINPGNSGGPTFNSAGQVIGINSSIASMTDSSSSGSEAGSIGIGFAIPANLVKRVSSEIQKDGSVKHVALGVSIVSATATSDGVTRGGAKISAGSNGGSAVVAGSPAAKAGLKSGDIIVAFNGNAVNDTYSLLGYVRAAALGDKVTLTVVRGTQTIQVEVTLDQEESTVTGKNRSDNSSGNSGNSQNNNNNDNSNNGDNSDGSTDPFSW